MITNELMKNDISLSFFFFFEKKRGKKGNLEIVDLRVEAIVAEMLRFFREGENRGFGGHGG